ncbi:MAG: polyprenyl synthetase family protein, partial [Chloroflexota bacterium]
LPAAVACEFMAAGFDLLDAGDDRVSSSADVSLPVYAGGMTLLWSAQELLLRLDCAAERRVRAAAILARACRRTLAAQIQDVALRGQAPASAETVLAVLHRRSGTLVAAPCQCAVALHGGSRHALALAGRFGMALGGAAQLEDDLADLAADAAGGRQTLPTALAALHPREPELVTAITWVLIQRFLREAAVALDRLSPYCRRPEVLWTRLPPALRIG